jgi:hypothetical protein
MKILIASLSILLVAGTAVAAPASRCSKVPASKIDPKAVILDVRSEGRGIGAAEAFAYNVEANGAACAEVQENEDRIYVTVYWPKANGGYVQAINPFAK